MGFCKYGNQKRVGNGEYYICSVTGYPCKFARWCSSECKYKPNANFNSCGIKVKQEKSLLEKAAQKQEKKSRAKRAKKSEPIVEEIVESEITVEETVNE